MDSIDNIIEETQYRDTNGKFIKLEKFMFFRELAKFARAESEVVRFFFFCVCVVCLCQTMSARPVELSCLLDRTFR